MDFNTANPNAFRAELAALAEENRLHGDLLEAALAACRPGQHADVCDAILRQPIVLNDFDLLEPLRCNSHPETLASCASTFARFGIAAEPTLVEMLGAGKSYDYDFGAQAATALQDIGTAASLPALFKIVDSSESKSRLRQAAKDALLAIEARIGPIPNRPHRAVLWEFTLERDPKPRFDDLWEQAANDRLHGELLETSFDEETEVWPRRQVLCAAFEQETDLRDVPLFLKASQDENRAIRASALGRLWRFGQPLEEALIGFLEDKEAAQSAARSLQIIGTPKSLPSLTAHAAIAESGLARSGTAQNAIEAIKARMHGSGERPN